MQAGRDSEPPGRQPVGSALKEAPLNRFGAPCKWPAPQALWALAGPDPFVGPTRQQRAPLRLSPPTGAGQDSQPTATQRLRFALDEPPVRPFGAPKGWAAPSPP